MPLRAASAPWRTTPAMRLALLACLALFVGGCTVMTGRITHYTPARAALQDKVDCLATSEWRPGYGASDPASNLMGSLPEGFVPVRVVRCVRDYLPTPDPSGNQGSVIVQEHLEGDYTALLSALSQPSDRGDGSTVCSADMELTPPGLWLVNAAGQAVHVVWPVDVCGKTRGKPDTAKALEALAVGDVTTLTAPTP